MNLLLLYVDKTIKLIRIRNAIISRFAVRNEAFFQVLICTSTNSTLFLHVIVSVLV